jgi:DNA-binding MarR family transcriptional regulator
MANNVEAPQIVPLPCACANLRRAARVVTRLYDTALRPSGLGVAQFTLLQALNEAPEISQAQLADLLGIDSTTLTRTLAPLRRKKWLRSAVGSDRREVRLSLTTAGKQEYRRALPYWRWAQQELRRGIGKTTWDGLMDVAVRTVGAVKPD